MQLWRISNYADLRGIGGLRAHGRWHLAGQPVVYLAEHPALALLEVLVHLELGSLDALPLSYQLLQIEVDHATTVAEIQPADMPAGWAANLVWTQAVGTEWLAGGTSALLRVPSAILPVASNYLFNPQHPQASGLRITEVMQVAHDPRVLAMLAGHAGGGSTAQG